MRLIVLIPSCFNGASASLPRMRDSVLASAGVRVLQRSLGFVAEDGVGEDQRNFQYLQLELRALARWLMRFSPWSSPRSGRRHSNWLCFQGPGGVREHGPAVRRRVPARSVTQSLDHNRASLRRRVRSTHRRNCAAPPPLFGADVNEEHLVIAMMDDAPEPCAKLDERSVRQLAPEDRELNVVAVPLHELEDLPEALGVADVIRDDVRLSHRKVQRVRKEGYAPISPSRHRASSRVCTSSTRR